MNRKLLRKAERAIEQHDLGELTACLAEQPIIVSAPLAEDEYQLLHYAAWQNFSEAIPLLVRQGADVNAGDGLGQTPLHYAAHHGKVEAAVALVDLGADINRCTQSGRSPLSYSVGYPVGDMLIARGATIDWNSAVWMGRADIIRQSLAEQQSEFSPRDLLSEAILAQQLEMVGLALDAGADPNELYTSGEAPIHLSVKASYYAPAIASLLIARGADPNLRTQPPAMLARATALDIAIFFSNAACEALLRQHGVQ